MGSPQPLAVLGAFFMPRPLLRSASADHVAASTARKGRP